MSHRPSPLRGAAYAGTLAVRDRQHVRAGPQVRAAARVRESPRHRLHILRQKVAKAAAAYGRKRGFADVVPHTAQRSRQRCGAFRNTPPGSSRSCAALRQVQG